MDKIFHSTFDFFSHAIPGALMVTSFLLLDEKITAPKDFLTLVNEFKVGSGIAILVMGYVVGFAFYPVGRYLYKKLGFRLWPKKIKQDQQLFISDKYILIRELSPLNFRYVETWNMFSAMAHNLAVASIFGMAAGLIKMLCYQPGNLLLWILFVCIHLLLFLLFLHRAVVFSIWAADDLNASIATLRMQERAKDLGKKGEE